MNKQLIRTFYWYSYMLYHFQNIKETLEARTMESSAYLVNLLKIFASMMSGDHG